jgi:hypothetical protein
MARIKFSKYDPQDGHLIEERDLTIKDVDDLFFQQATIYGAVTQRNEPDGTITGEVYESRTDSTPLYNYKITFPK